MPIYEKSLKHFRYSVFVILAFIILLDLGLRFFTKKYRSYSEINYGWFYISPFTDGFSVLKQKLFYDSLDFENNTHPRNTEYSFETSDFCFLHKYNEYGIRERNNLKELIQGKTVILTIGDSFTEGVGTSQDSTWQRILETRLNETISSYFVVVNAGVSGSDPIQEVKLLEKLTNELQPNYVIISIGSNDLMDIVENPDNSRSLINSQPLGYYFYSWSFLYRAVSTLFYDYPEIFMNQKKFDVELQKSSEIIYNQIYQITEMGNVVGFKTIVVFFPSADELINYQYKYSSFATLIHKTRNTDKIFSVDILEFFTENKNAFILPEDILYWPADGHMTPVGYRIWSDILYADLNQNDVLKKNAEK